MSLGFHLKFIQLFSIHILFIAESDADGDVSRSHFLRHQHGKSLSALLGPIVQRRARALRIGSTQIVIKLTAIFGEVNVNCCVKGFAPSR